MQRIKLEMPSSFSFSTTLKIRITDLNYGGHVGNDSFLTLMHEARMQYLKSHNYSETNLEGVGLIMIDAFIEFKTELFYADNIVIYITAQNFFKYGFELYYQFIKDDTVVCNAKTTMLCMDYSLRKKVSLPEAAKQKLAEQ